MNYGKLSKYFSAFAAKQLSPVETNPKQSNQHEFNGVVSFQEILGKEKIEHAPATFMYFDDDSEFNPSCSDFLTWYDARENHPTRTEYRLYFPSNEIMSLASENDLMLLGKRQDGSMLVVIAKAESTRENQIRLLFGLGHNKVQGVISKVLSSADDSNISFITNSILENIGVSTDEVYCDSDLLEMLLGKFPKGFPTTKIFSELSRSLVKDECNSVDAPDDALIKWLEMEEKLFRTMEWHYVSQKLREGFSENVDEFISYSLSIQNRRKARVGAAFENHLEQLFLDNKVKYVRGAMTDNRSKPDFLFPGIGEYNDSDFPTNKLYMLGAKTTCKDRWRQVTSEAQKIKTKHLATLEPGISENQTQEMRAHDVQLVIPKSIHATFTEEQKSQILSISDFMRLL